MNKYQFNLEDFPVGKAKVTEAHFPAFYGGGDISVPIYVNRAKNPGHTVVVTGCIHGDEIVGLRVIMKLIESKLKLKKGNLIAIPILNPYGFYHKTRYLPDRKDLNRQFPGNPKGSFGQRFASFIMRNFGQVGDFYIDLHSGGLGRLNIPQIRYDFKLQGVSEVLEDIKIPLVVNSKLRDGSFREALSDNGIPCIVFEGGEGLRVDKNVSQDGLLLIKSVLSHFGMIRFAQKKIVSKKIFIKRTRWLRSPCGGFQINHFKLGNTVKKGQLIAEIKSPKAEVIQQIFSPADGVILGMNVNPLVMAGDALYNLGFLREDQDLPEEEGVFDWDEY